MSKRKLVKPVLKFWPELDLALARLCQLDAKRKKYLLAMNAAIDAAKEKHLPVLNDIADEDARLWGDIHQFCQAHRADFEPRKSVERLHGILSFRTSPPAVKPVSRRWTWKRILQILVDRMPMYVRQKPEVDKEAILADYVGKTLSDEDLKTHGLRVCQDETFGVELKYEEGPENEAH